MDANVKETKRKAKMLLKGLGYKFRKSAVEDVQDGMKIFFRDVRRADEVIGADDIHSINESMVNSGMLGKIMPSMHKNGTYNLVIKVHV